MNRYKYIDEVDEDGKPQHLHTLDGKPLTGTSGVTNIFAKPLTWWAVGLALEPLGWKRNYKEENGKKVYLKKEDRIISASLGKQKIKDMTDEEYLTTLDDCYRAHDKSKDSSAVAGTDLHGQLETFIKTGEITDRIIPFVEWAKDNVSKYLWSEMHCYSEKEWLGGITDVGVELKNGEFAIIDFKSSKTAYASQFFQIGGYDLQITENGGFDRNGNKTFELDKPITTYIVVPFGSPTFKPVVYRGVDGCKESFLGGLKAMREKQKIEM